MPRAETEEQSEVLRQQATELPEIGCYPAQFNQVWLSLLRNAADSIEDGGKIRLSSSLENKSARIIVSDTGRGIPAGQLRNIFDCRFTAGPARVKMGSGLSVAYNVIQKHKGDITISSQPGQGTTVAVTLPVGWPPQLPYD
ncbi:MAG: ATP-binding protein [bacterium]